jgi:hypothetical protein
VRGQLCLHLGTSVVVLFLKKMPSWLHDDRHAGGVIGIVTGLVFILVGVVLLVLNKRKIPSWRKHTAIAIIAIGTCSLVTGCILATLPSGHDEPVTSLVNDVSHSIIIDDAEMIAIPSPFVPARWEKIEPTSVGEFSREWTINKTNTIVTTPTTMSRFVNHTIKQHIPLIGHVDVMRNTSNSEIIVVDNNYVPVVSWRF